MYFRHRENEKFICADLAKRLHLISFLSFLPFIRLSYAKMKKVKPDTNFNVTIQEYACILKTQNKQVVL